MIAIGGILLTITVAILFQTSTEGYLKSDLQNRDSLEQWGSYSGLLEDPQSVNASFYDSTVGGMKFVLYEDFPINITSINPPHLLKVINLPSDNWSKFIFVNGSHTKDSGLFLRIFGMVKPFESTPFNETLYAVGHSQNNSSFDGSVTIIKNKIIYELSPIRSSVPFKFKNELYAYPNSKLFYIFGVVFDSSPWTNMNNFSTENSSLSFNIDQLGIINKDGVMESPNWLKIKVLHLPTLLEEDKPDFFVLALQTSNAPLGSYQLMFHETVQGETFVETATMTVRNR